MDVNLPIVYSKANFGGFFMETHYSADIVRCPRCGSPLPGTGVACERRSCRSTGLRVTRLRPLDKDTDPTSSLVDAINRRKQTTEPITPPGIATPSLEQKERE